MSSPGQGRTVAASGKPIAENLLHFTTAAAKSITLDADTKYIKFQYDSTATTVTWDRYGGTAALPTADDSSSPISMWPGASGDGGEEIGDRAGSTISVWAADAIDITVSEHDS